jgi:hypothetical protein
MPYVYASNLDPQNSFDQIEIQLDSGDTAILRQGHSYDLTAGELRRARAYIVLVASSDPAEEPIGVVQLPIKGNPTDGQIPQWDATEGAFRPVSDVSTPDPDAAIIAGTGPPFVLQRYHLRDFPSVRDHSAGKPTGDADNTEAFGEMLADTQLQSLLVPPNASGAHYNVTDIVMCTRDRVTLHSHEGAIAEVKQQLLGRPTFFISGADCAVANIRAGSGPTLTTRTSWSFDKLSSAENLLVNQDATSSRWAGWYLWGAQRFKGWRMGWEEAYCGVRVRPRDRFSTDPTTALFGVEIINPHGRRHIFGINAMGWATGTLRGMRTSETLSVDTVPPHALYLAGAGNIPSDIIVPGHPVTSTGSTFSTGTVSHGFTANQPVEFDNLTGGGIEVQTGVIYYVRSTGLTSTAFQISATVGGAAITPSVDISAGYVTGTPDIDFDGDSDVPAGKADLPMRLFLLADCIDYDNQWSSSYKIRNGFGIGVHDLFSHRAAMAFQASYLERCHLSRIEAHDAVQIYSQSTNLPADSGTQEMGQFNYCSWNLIDDVFLHSELGRYVGGLSLRNACGHNRIRRPHVALNVSSDAGRAHYKTIDSANNTYEAPGIDLKGVAMIPIRGFNAENNVYDRPRVDAGSLTVPTLARFDNDSVNNVVPIDRRKLSAGVSPVIVDDANSNNVPTFPDDTTPPTVFLTDAATIATNAALGKIFAVTIAGNRTMGAPTNPSAGQQIVYRIKQDATGSRTITWNAIFRFSDDTPTVTLSTIAGRTDYVAFTYNAADAKWDIAGVQKGLA